MVKIARSWSEALRVVGIDAHCEVTDLGSAQFFMDYQAGTVDDDEYLGNLAQYLCITEIEAARAHAGILMMEYAEVGALVAQLHGAGIVTGCLSNTNALHWKDLTDPNCFPSIASLRFQMASHVLKMSKPHSEIYDAFRNEVGFHPQDIVFFDDSPTNIEAAISLGWRAHHIDPHTETAPQMVAHLQAEGMCL